MQLTLTNRLRLAALSRAEHGGRVVGTYVIDEEGVIDLRALEDRGPESRASDLAPLGDTAGRFGDAADVSDLYDDEHHRGRRWLGLRKTEQSASSTRSDGPTAVIDTESVDETETVAKAESVDETETIGHREMVEADGPDPAPASVAPPVIDLRSGDESGDEPGPVELLDDDMTSLQKAIEEFNAQAPRLDPEPAIHVEAAVVNDSSVDTESSADVESTDRSEPARAQRSLFGPAEPEEPPVTGEPEADYTGDAKADGADSEAPTRCPVCGGPARMDFANQFLEVDFYSCRECFHMWHAAARGDNS